MGVSRPVLRYHGGKWKLAPWIIANMPAHRIYVEPFGGGASVLLRKKRSYSEVYNDAWNVVVNVFEVLRDETKAARLAELLYLTPYSRTEFDQCGDSNLIEIDDAVECARRTILRSFAGFGSASTNVVYTTGFRANSNRSGTVPAHDWENYPDHVKTFVERLRGVCIEHGDATRCMLQHDTRKTLFFVDPPYVHVTRNMQRGNAAYACEMDDSDHVRLAATLIGLEGMVMLSGYRCDLYDELYKGWLRIDREAMADGARKRVESLWFNPSAQKAKTQLQIFQNEAVGK